MSERLHPFSKYAYQIIGELHSEHVIPKKTPIQPVFARDIPGTLVVRPPFVDGLKDIEGFSHLILIYHLHRAGAPRLHVTPFMGDRVHGIFATRHPLRPNPIGLSIVRLVRREGDTLRLLDVDILDGTPVLDIKPFVPKFDVIEGARGGWTEEVDEDTKHRRGLRGYDASGKAPLATAETRP